MCAAPEAPRSEAPGGHVLDIAEHIGSLLPRIPTPGSGGTLAANKGDEFVISRAREERYHNVRILLNPLNAVLTV